MNEILASALVIYNITRFIPLLVFNSIVGHFALCLFLCIGIAQ